MVCLFDDRVLLLFIFRFNLCQRPGFHIIHDRLAFFVKVKAGEVIFVETKAIKLYV